MQAFCLPPEEIEKARQSLSDSAEPFSVWPESAAAVTVFCGLQTQWNRSPAGFPAGIDYTAVPVVMSMYGVADEEKAAVFDGLQQMEIQALKIWRKQA